MVPPLLTHLRRNGSRWLVVLMFSCAAVSADDRRARYLNNKKETGARFMLEDGSEMVNVVVNFKVGVPSIVFNGQTISSQFERTNAASITVPLNSLYDLLSLQDVDSVEEDSLVFKFSETIPWGVSVVQGTSNVIPDSNSYTPSSSGSSSYSPNSPHCFGVCIVDSGVFLDHPDMPFNLNDPNVHGQSFSVPADQLWYAPMDVHGTHVAGTIFARGGNNEGVVGIIPDPGPNICLNVARVFDDGDGITSTSTIDRAVEWCADVGSKVINMSLGTSYQSANSAAIIKRIVEEENILVVAAAGNDGKNELYYPASYNQVISVASVDPSLLHSDFSNYNTEVDISAPGKNILSLSTQPTMKIVDMATNGEIQGSLMQDSVVPTGVLSGRPVYCGLGDTTCTQAAGNICVIQRGGSTFRQKAQNCQDGGGIAALIYNNVDGPFSGTLVGTGILIPVASLSLTDGPTALLAQTLAISMGGGAYIALSGTSMAAPHVTGVIAKLWSIRPACTNQQIRDAIEVSARDLGTLGRDDLYGYGLIQATAAYEYLLALPSPCGNAPGQSSLLQPSANVILPDQVQAPKELHSGLIRKQIGPDDYKEKIVPSGTRLRRQNDNYVYAKEFGGGKRKRRRNLGDGNSSSSYGISETVSNSTSIFASGGGLMQ